VSDRCADPSLAAPERLTWRMQVALALILVLQMGYLIWWANYNPK
jgi:hypothetical protein